MGFLVFDESGGKLVGTRSVASAPYAFESFDDLIYGHVVDNLRYALKISAATAYEFNVVNSAVIGHVE